MSTVKRIASLMARTFRVHRWEEGQTLPEYALILAVVAVAVISAAMFLSDQISALFTRIGNLL